MSHPGFEYRSSRISRLVDEKGSWSHPKIEYRSSRLGLLVEKGSWSHPEIEYRSSRLGPKALTTRFVVPLTLSEQRKVGSRGSQWSYDS